MMTNYTPHWSTCCSTLWVAPSCSCPYRLDTMRAAIVGCSFSPTTSCLLRKHNKQQVAKVISRSPHRIFFSYHSTAGKIFPYFPSSGRSEIGIPIWRNVLWACGTATNNLRINCLFLWTILLNMTHVFGCVICYYLSPVFVSSRTSIRSAAFAGHIRVTIRYRIIGQKSLHQVRISLIKTQDITQTKPFTENTF